MAPPSSLFSMNRIIASVFMARDAEVCVELSVAGMDDNDTIGCPVIYEEKQGMLWDDVY